MLPSPTAPSKPAFIYYNFVSPLAHSVLFNQSLKIWRILKAAFELHNNLLPVGVGVEDLRDGRTAAWPGLKEQRLDSSHLLREAYF